MNKTLSTLISTSVLATGLTVVSMAPAQAFNITQTGTSGGNPGGLPVYEVSGLVEGDSFQVDYDYSTLPWLAAVADVVVTSLTSSNAKVQVTLTNNSPTTGTAGNPATNTPRITAFGLSVDNFTGLGGGSSAGAILDSFDDGNFPGFSSVVGCATSGSNCAGGGQGGIGAGGGSDTFTFSLNGSFGATPSLTLDAFAIKIQSGPNGDSFEVPGTPIPEPLTMLGSGIALGFGSYLKRKMDKQKTKM
jgi:hypothetical protein